MEIRHLHYFKILAEELHFGKAAKRLFISQPPLSRQIKELEQEIGAKLFDRNNKRVSLTDAGRYFLTECEGILQNLEKAKNQTRILGQAETGTFRLGYISCISKSILAGILKQVQDRYPFYQIHLFETSTLRQKEALEQGKLDLGIVRAPLLSSRLAQENLFKDSFVLAVHSSFLFSGDYKVLAHCPFVSYNSLYAPVYHQKVLELCNELGFDPQIKHECNTVSSILEMVQHQLGIAIIPKSAQGQYPDLDIRYIDLLNTDITTQIVLAHDRSAASPILSYFKELISKAMG